MSGQTDGFSASRLGDIRSVEIELEMAYCISYAVWRSRFRLPKSMDLDVVRVL